MMNDYGIEEGGFILINKPLRWTSFDVVKKLRNISRIKKIGHAGTLDPLATGLLIVCYGKYTKKIESLQSQAKVYRGTFEIGQTTPSFDLEMEVDAEYPVAHIDEALVQQTIPSFLGNIEQTPPQYSAVKIKGKRAYEHARKGEKVVLKKRQVSITRFDVDASNLPTLSFKIHCSKGTYIRSIARDLGIALQSGAYMSSLHREQIGSFHSKNAVEIETLVDQDVFFEHAQQFAD